MCSGQLIVEDAEFVTMAPAGRAESMLVRDGRIAAIGPAAAVRAAAEPGAAVVRLDGATVIPGLIDAHCHVMNIGYLAAGADCSQPAAPDIAAVQARLREAADRTPARSWVTGSGYVEYKLAEQQASDPRGSGRGRAGPPGSGLPHVAARVRAQLRRAARGRVRRRPAGPARWRSRPRRPGQAHRRAVRRADVPGVRRPAPARPGGHGRGRAGPGRTARRAAAGGAGHHRGLRRGHALPDARRLRRGR